MSWLLAIPFSYPASIAISEMIGEQLLQYPLIFSYSIQGMAAWLAIVVILAALASLWPALQASGISVQEALVYE